MICYKNRQLTNKIYISLGYRPKFIIPIDKLLLQLFRELNIYYNFIK